jgi:hypothetical protein
MQATAADGLRVLVGGPGRAVDALLVADVLDLQEIAKDRVAASARVCPMVLHDPDLERIYDVPGTPFALVLDELGTVRAKGTVNNLEQVEGLVDVALRRMGEVPERRAS